MSLGRPNREELHLMNIAAHLAGIAIEQRLAIQALHQSEERNRAILRAIPDWMFLLSADGVFLDYHAKDPDKLLAPPSVFLGKTMLEIMPPGIAEALTRACARALESDQPETLEYTIGSDDEERFYEAPSCGAVPTSSSASSGTSPIANEPSLKPTYSAASSRT